MRRRTRPPAAVETRVTEAGGSGERILGWAETPAGWLITTDTALYSPDAARSPWPDVQRAAWDTPVLEAVIGGRTYRWTLPEPGAVPAVVHERVTATIVVQHYVELRPGHGARLIARRQPGDTDITWRVIFDAGLDAGDPDLRAQATQALADFRATTGL